MNFCLGTYEWLGLVHFSRHQFAADPNPNQASNRYKLKHYTGVR